MGKRDQAAKGARETMKQSDLRPSASPVLRGILRPKGGSKSGAPDNAGTATNRKDTLNVNLGARRVIDPNFNALPASNPESSATQAKGRIVRSMPSRWGNFGEGINYSRGG